LRGRGRIGERSRGPRTKLRSSPIYLCLFTSWIFEAVTEGTVRAAATMRAQSERAHEAIKTALRDTVMQYQRGEYFEVPTPAVLATAVKA
jgi:hypothetical protein